jgi:hypothetical protein
MSPLAYRTTLAEEDLGVFLGEGVRPTAPEGKRAPLVAAVYDCRTSKRKVST